ncbi:MAG: SusC/RagA family TonB-linked outer membrane protein, partial [Alistipes sp.]|nr:SusC/RagA family TonB-linked outer membrane protein [Candidatus Minthomonas equi]
MFFPLFMIIFAKKDFFNVIFSTLKNILTQLSTPMNFKHFLISLLAFTVSSAISLTAYAQNSVKGTVTDPSGQPVIGAAVLVLEETSRGTVTDENGDWSLEVKSGTTLQFSSIGYKTREIKVGSKTRIDVVLEEDIDFLDDVVVIGYGSARKGDMTGSMSSVQGEKLTERSTQMLSNTLQGQIAGVQVTRSSGGPGESSSIRIHGVTTMSNSDPLVIIDGVPGELDDVLADDVETLTVLKDAAAAAIYGSRAAAGVILITTKRAKENKLVVKYSYQYAIDTPTTRPKNGDVIDWFNVQNEMKWNDGAQSQTSVYSQELIDGWMANNATDPIHYPNTDWTDLVIKKTTSHQQHNFEVAGGNDKLRTKLSLNYQTGNGYIANKSYERFSGRINNDWRIAKWLGVKADVDFSKSRWENPAAGESTVIYYAYTAAPYYNAFWADGRHADCKDGANINAALLEGGTSENDYYKFGGKIQLDITPIKSLTITALFAPRFTFYSNKNFSKTVHVYKEDGTALAGQWNKTTNLSESRNNWNNYTYQAYANYAEKWGDHSFSAMAGYEGFTYFRENLGASRNNYLLDTYPYLNLGPEDYQYNTGNASHNAYQSVFGRVMYSFKDRYMIQANVRGDASSRFAKENRWGVFPSVSAGWVISSEPWFKSEAVNYFKLRGSYGELGNERIGSDFPYQATMSFGNSYMYDKSSQSVSALQNAAQVYYAFKDITWETTTSAGVGVDMYFLDSRLRFTGDYYHKKTKNMLLTLGFPSYSGFSAPSQNAGDMYTNGWDIELGWSGKVGDFSYRIAA